MPLNPQNQERCLGSPSQRRDQLQRDSGKPKPGQNACCNLFADRPARRANERRKPENEKNDGPFGQGSIEEGRRPGPRYPRNPGPPKTQHGRGTGTEDEMNGMAFVLGQENRVSSVYKIEGTDGRKCNRKSDGDDHRCSSECPGPVRRAPLRLPRSPAPGMAAPVKNWTSGPGGQFMSILGRIARRVLWRKRAKAYDWCSC